MPIIAVDKDLEALTMTIVTEHRVPVRRLWDAYADPRQLERFWGPPEWPATFLRHDMTPGGRSHYVMTGAGGESAGGYWEFVSVDAPRSFEVLDGFALADGTPNAELPVTRMIAVFDETAEGSRVTLTSHFGSLAELEQLLAMGVEEGFQLAVAQIDAVVADLASFAAERSAEARLLDDTRVRVARVIRGSVEQVWRAHHDAALLQRWMLGPDGWVMPVCEPATEVGQRYRYEWENAEGGERFGFVGELLEAQPPHRAVTTEQMIGMEGPGTVNELTLTAVEGGTLLSMVITYPSRELRDFVLGTGMVDGMESSYARLEAVALDAE